MCTYMQAKRYNAVFHRRAYVHVTCKRQSQPFPPLGERVTVGGSARKKKDLQTNNKYMINDNESTLSHSLSPTRSFTLGFPCGTRAVRENRKENGRIMCPAPLRCGGEATGKKWSIDITMLSQNVHHFTSRTRSPFYEHLTRARSLSFSLSPSSLFGIFFMKSGS